MQNAPETDATIRQRAAPGAFRQGTEYYTRGAVASLTRRGNALHAEVEGSRPSNHRVRVASDAAGITEAACSCGGTYGGWCTHVVATLLAALHDPESIAQQPDLEGLLAGLDRDGLQALALDLAARESALTDTIYSQAAILQGRLNGGSSMAGQRQRRTLVDSDSFRQQVRAALGEPSRTRSFVDYGRVGGVLGELRQVLNRARAFTRAGDGRNALAILGVITEEYVEGWTLLDGSSGDSGDFFWELGEEWAAALLIADLPPAGRRPWIRKLRAWWEELEDYCQQDAFDMAIAVANHGWEYPRLPEALRGEISESIWEGKAVPRYARSLVRLWLETLEHQRRHEEYLRLARAEGQAELYATMLVRLGRTEEAVEYGLTRLSSPDEALALSKSLRRAGNLDAALQIGERGLTLEGRKVALAIWQRDVAGGMGQRDRALDAALVTLREDPDLTAYLRVQELAGERWPEYRTELLSHVRQNSSLDRQGAVDILLHEGLISDAIAIVSGSWDDRLVARVVDAAITYRPNWVIATCRARAERIMDAGKAGAYESAARWLGRAAEGYRAAGREGEWRVYLDELLARHGRKHKLTPMLEALR